MEKLSPSIVARYICENALAVTTTPNSLPISRDSKNPGSPPPKRIAALYLPVSQACETGKYNAAILLGGGEPGFLESREIGREFGVVVTANAFSQMYLATMLGDSFSIIDIEGVHNVYYRDLVRTHQLTHRCRSISL